MGLQKSVDTSFGVPATYWRIKAKTEVFGDTVSLTIAGYPSKSIRDDNPEPIVTREVYLSGESYLQDAPRSDLYLALKALPDWAGAIDA